MSFYRDQINDVIQSYSDALEQIQFEKKEFTINIVVDRVNNGKPPS